MLQFRDSYYFYLYMGLSDDDVRANGKYSPESPQPALERLITYYLLCNVYFNIKWQQPINNAERYKTDGRQTLF